MIPIITYARISQDVYQKTAMIKTSGLSAWSRIELLPLGGLAKGFYGCLYVNPNIKQVVLAYRGTTKLSNWQANTDILIKRIKGRYYESTKWLYLKALQWVAEHFNTLMVGSHLSLTGHSLGGMLAKFIAVDHPQVNAYVFDAPGIGQVHCIDADSTYPNIINITSEYSKVSNLGEPVGQVIPIKAGDMAMCHPWVRRINTSLYKELYCEKNLHSIESIIKAIARKQVVAK